MISFALEFPFIIVQTQRSINNSKDYTLNHRLVASENLLFVRFNFGCLMSNLLSV